MITILGYGQMGKAILHGMMKLRPDYKEDWNVVDNTLINHGSDVFPLSENVRQYTEINDELIDRSDIVISAMPYHQNLRLAKKCVQYGISYIDLGGKVDVSEQINALSSDSLIFTDLGLAPGLVNILAEEAYQKYKADGIHRLNMYCGGLPVAPDIDDPFKYECTWSYDGLVNEYRDDCVVLEGGEIKSVAGMEGRVGVNFIQANLEAFYTSGGASHTVPLMHERGLQHCAYRTIRYRGHHALIQHLIRTCAVNDETMIQILSKNHTKSAGTDKVLVGLEIDAGFESYFDKYVFYADDDFTAMQRSTAFPLCAVADLVLDGVMPNRSCTYADIPFMKFREKLDMLGFSLNPSKVARR